ncbi:DUF443 family protein [Listeria booriae]|uniref:DUF443 family protein n=1 Tax=Listeria booriae TaxID=1552123 RepID=UPI0028937F49|nr:DUF443 family protein [Listeria booriae]
MKIIFGEMKSVYKNSRYKILEYDSKFYLIDIDKGFYGFLLFALSWIIPIKAILITQRDADDLRIQKVNDTRKNPYPNFMLMCVLIISNLVLPSLLIPIFKEWSDGAVILSVGLLSIFAVVIRVIYSKKNKMEHINSGANKEIWIKLMPRVLSYYFKSICVYLLFLIVVIVGAYLSIIVEGYWILSLCYTIVLYLFLLTNRLAYNASKYKIERWKEK